MPRARIGQKELNYEERGRGTAVLCMPGALGTGSSDFRPQLEVWSSQFQVIAPDPSGYGRSRPHDRDFSRDFFTEDALEMGRLMEDLGHRAFHLVGFSDGANSAALLAAKFPEKVLKLVIWGGNSYLAKEDIEGLEKTRLISSWSPRMRESLEAVYGSSLQSIWSGYCDSIRSRFETAPNICRNELAYIRCPSLILHGAHDPIVAPHHAQTFQDGIKNSRIHFLPNGRHNIHLSQADEFNRLVADFFHE
jgi:valacyclovir hydrolase